MVAAKKGVVSCKERIIEVAATMPQPFFADDLVVAVWKRYPAQFSIKGHDLPCSNKVLSLLMGRNGLERQGKLRKVAPRIYEVSFMPVAKEPEIRTIPLNKQRSAFVEKMLASVVIDKYRNSDQQILTFHHACRFWDMSEVTNGEKATDQLRLMDERFIGLENAMHDQSVELVSGRVLSPSEFRTLRNIHESLKSTFERKIELLCGKPIKHIYSKKKVKN